MRPDGFVERRRTEREAEKAEVRRREKVCGGVRTLGAGYRSPAQPGHGREGRAGACRTSRPGWSFGIMPSGAENL